MEMMVRTMFCSDGNISKRVMVIVMENKLGNSLIKAQCVNDWLMHHYGKISANSADVLILQVYMTT